MISRSDIIAAAEPAPNRMLAPSAYSEALLPSLRLARSSRFARRIGQALLVSLVIGTGFVAVAPWQQSVTGSGDVIAFAPMERQQTIEVPIKGRIVRLGENVFENAHVNKGDIIAEVQDVDPRLLSRLQDQLTASQAQVDAAKLLMAASERNRDAALTIVGSWQNQLNTYRTVKEQIVASADAAIAAAEAKVEAERKKLEEVQASLAQVDADFERQKTLFEEDIVAEVKFQMAERKKKEMLAKVKQSEAYVESALSDLEGKQRDRNAKEQKAQVDIDYAQASLDKSRSEVAKAESDVAKAGAELNKAQKLLSEMETKFERQKSQVIEAPFDGFLTKISATLGQMLKEGDTLCVIVPDTKDRAVRVWLDGNDAPLVSPGRHVRLQFEGWPAVQFAGWPSVAVGTFGGTVVSVDATDDGKGKFRVLIRPEPLDPEVVGLVMDPTQMATVKDVASDSPAALAGVRAGDEIELIDRQPILSVTDIQSALHRLDADGGVVPLTLRRNGATVTASLQLNDGWRHLNQEWPRDRYLRQGVRANAWVLLERVPLWYEIWRNMNGFPPVVTQAEGESKDKSKPPKLPK
jgi:multidrug resistance efflux pump